MRWAVLMAGGSGTRFWPESREKKPKQFLKIFGKRTLLEETLYRLPKAVPKQRTLVVTQKSYSPQVIQLLKIPGSQVLGEPVGRNTAPCAVLAARLLIEKDPDAVLAILPSDHRIGKPALFRKALLAAYSAAEKTGKPVTFGIRPDFPHTGYGYLEMGRPAGKFGGFSFSNLQGFHEKPAFEKAQAYLKSGKFLWNSGMFVWRADRLLEAAREHLPQAVKLSDQIVKGPFEKKFRQLYPAMPATSIDFGLMEKLKDGILTMPVDLDWHDLGGWRVFETLWPADEQKNVSRSLVLPVESSGNIVKSDGKLVALLGVHNMIVVDTPDALLICPKEEAESIRKIVFQLKKNTLKKFS